MPCCPSSCDRKPIPMSRPSTPAATVRQLDERPHPGRPPIGALVSEPRNCAELPTMDHVFPAQAVGALIAPPTQVPTRLLLVEDNTSTSFAIRAFFQRVGYDVDAAADHATAS